MSPAVYALTLGEDSKLDNNSNSNSSQTLNVEVKNNELNKESINSKGSTTNVPVTTSTEQISTEAAPKTENVDASSEQAAKVQSTTSEKLAKSAAQTDETLDSWMPDKALQRAVFESIKYTIHISSASQITKENITKLEELYIDKDAPVSSLEGLQYATGLYSFIAEGQQSEDVFNSLPNYVPQIYWLSWYDSNISNVSMLTKMPNLTVIGLSKNKISDISPLQNLPKLSEMSALVLDHNEITDVSALKNFNWGEGSNQDLDISYNHITDIAPLSGKNNKVSAFVTATHQSITLPSIEVSSQEYSQEVSTPNTWSDYLTYTLAPDMGTSNGSAEGSTDLPGSTYTIKWTKLEKQGNLEVCWDSKEDHTETIANDNGKFSGEIIQPYTYFKESSVTVKYVDTEGNKISDDAVLSGNVGDAYSTEQKDIKGYTFKEVQGNPAGQFTDQAQTVTYVYTKNLSKAGDVTVKYVDTEGNKISDDAALSGNVGDAYSTEQKDIKGYTFKEVQGNPAGQFTDQAQTVTYVYTKDKVNPVKPIPNDNNPSHKEDTSKSESSSTHDALPETGENERMTLISVGTGLIFLMVALIASVFRFKRFKNNK
ncbi:MucBP domain-containing protein (plasmid) [Lactococcus petauri]|nr:MucBP domain-containing protein [Lactococcus petauri]